MTNMTTSFFLTGFLLLPAVHTLGQQFTRVTTGPLVNDGASSWGCSWGDYDGDGDVDLFVANGDDTGSNFLYENNGDGTFTLVGAGGIVAKTAFSNMGTWGDYNNDGHLDLFVAEGLQPGETNALFRNNGDGQFSRITGDPLANELPGLSAAWGDYNNDSHLDLMLASRLTLTETGNSPLYRNLGDGTFRRILDGDIAQIPKDLEGVSWVDYDDDGDLDLFFPKGDGNRLYQNNGNGSFTPITSGAILIAPSNPRGASWGDYDNDGDLDLVVPHLAIDPPRGPSFLYENMGDRTFRRVMDAGSLVTDGSAAISSSWGDYDNDGDLDLFIANTLEVSTPFLEGNFLFENTGGSFRRITDSGIDTGPHNSAACSWADFDNDGDLDLFVANYNGENNLFYVNNGNDYTWLKLRCVGTASNTSAIGARVSVKATIDGVPGWQIREISGQTGRRSQNSLFVHFGLKQATVVDSLRIRWPSGTIQDTINVAVNQFLTMTEPPYVRVMVGDIARDTGASFGAAWGDYDNDGDPDLFVANSGGQNNNFLYRNDHPGGFIRITDGDIVNDGGISQSASWADYDNDGDLDLFVTNFGNNFLYRNNGNQTFTKIQEGAIVTDGGNSKGCSWGDYDGDGDLDLYVANDREDNFLYQNNGDGTFSRVMDGEIVNDGGNSFGCSWIDYDGDGDLDMYVTNIGPNFLYQNNGDGTFAKVTTASIVSVSDNSTGSSWADYDRDGDLDVFVTNLVRSTLHVNEGFDPARPGLITFREVQSVQTSGAQGSAWGDLDNDGFIDLLVGRSGINTLLRNDGTETLKAVSTGVIVTDSEPSQGTAWADFDLDGTLDLFIANNGAPNALYKTTRTGSSWINIKLQGRASNRTAIGSKVFASAFIDGLPVTQMREITAQSGYLGQNSLNAEFGLKDATVLDSIRVEWPSGAVNRFRDVAVDQFVVFEENNRPYVENGIPFITLAGQGAVFERDLLTPPVFLDADGDSLTLDIAVESDIAMAVLSGSSLTVTLQDATAPGKAIITLTADDGRVDDGRGDTERMLLDVNRPPLRLGNIEDKTFLPGTLAPFSEDLQDIFLDPDVGDNLSFRVINPDSSIAKTTVDAQKLTIARGDSLGQVRITVEADDRREGIARVEFTVRHISSNSEPVVINPIPDKTLILEGESLQQNLKGLFADADGDEFSFTASSSPPSVAFAEVVDDTVLVVEPLRLGEATITVRANDGIGGEASLQFNVEVLLSFRPAIAHQQVLSRDAGQPVAIEAQVIDPEGALQAATLSYRIAGSPDFESVAMDLSSVDDTTFQVSGAIPASAVTSRGLEYFIIAKDASGVQGREPFTGIISTRVRVDGDGVTKPTVQPSGSEESAFRLISIPLDLDDKSPESVFRDDLGPYDPAKWRLFQWVAAAGGGVTKVEFPNTSDLAPGTALWLVVKDAGKNVDSGPGTTESTSERFEISLNRGWNLIGNPFHFATVAEPTLADGAPLGLYAYDGSWSDQLDPASTQMQPFSGYAVFAPANTSMFIKPNPADTVDVLSKLDAMDDEALWSIRIRARAQSASDDNTILAVSEHANREWDTLDHPEPPGVGGYVSVYFPHPEWDKLNKRFSTDVRPVTAEGDEWQFAIETNIRDVVNLLFEGVASVPLEYEVWLVDKELKTATDLRIASSYSVAGRSQENPKRLSVLIGRKGFVEEHLVEFQVVPKIFELAQNFPNPFNPATTIQFGLPRVSQITLKVFNILGEEIVTLVDELKEPGYHAITWDGRNGAGSKVASGVYFYRIRAEDASGSGPGFVRIRKMVLIQ